MSNAPNVPGFIEPPAEIRQKAKKLALRGYDREIQEINAKIIDARREEERQQEKRKRAARMEEEARNRVILLIGKASALELERDEMRAWEV